MASFDSLNPATFGVSKGNFPGNYYYTIAVTPKNPDSYSGPPFYTVTSNTLLTNEEIISNAIAIASQRRGKSDPSQVLSFEVISGTSNLNLGTGFTGTAVSIGTATQQFIQNAIDFAQNTINNILSFLRGR